MSNSIPKRRRALSTAITLWSTVALLACGDDSPADDTQDDAADAADAAATLTPDAAATSPPDAASQATPDAASQATPDAAAQATPDAAAQAAPDAALPTEAPHFLTLTVSDEDALATGAVTIEANGNPRRAEWTAVGTDLVIVEEPLVPTAACQAVPVNGWGVTGSGGTEGARPFTTETADDKCMRFTAVGVPDDERLIFIKVLPGLFSGITSPANLPAAGATMLATGTTRGSATLRVTTAFVDQNGVQISQADRCASFDAQQPFATLNLPTGLFRCDFTIAASDIPPGATKLRIRYVTTDPQGDLNTKQKTLAILP